MTIQISVLIWTVICFVLLMLILNNLLFKPVLSLMDKRRNRIEMAAEKKLEIEKIYAEHDEACRKKKEMAYDAHSKQVREQIEEIHKQSKKDIDNAKAERLKKIDAYNEAVEAQQKNILDEFSVHSEKIAACFAESLIK